MGPLGHVEAKRAGVEGFMKKIQEKEISPEKEGRVWLKAWQLRISINLEENIVRQPP